MTTSLQFLHSYVINWLVGWCIAISEWLKNAAIPKRAAHFKEMTPNSIESCHNSIQLYFWQLTLAFLSDLRFNEAQVAFQGLGPTRANVQSIADVVKYYLRQFVAGRKSWQEVLNAQRKYAQARHALADMQASNRLAVLKMQVLTGELSRAAIEQSSGAWAIQAN